MITLELGCQKFGMINKNKMCDFHRSPRIVRIMIYRTQQWTGHVARIECTWINKEFL